MVKFILFLDFDGVLHSLNGTPFEHRKLFEDLLRAYPEVKIVFSTSWRFGFKFDIDRLAAHFSKDIRDRFIGCNPYLQEKWPPYIKYERYKECIAFMEGIDYKGPWLALDDSDDLYPDDCENLIVCKSWIGLDEIGLTKICTELNKYFTPLELV